MASEWKHTGTLKPSTTVPHDARPYAPVGNDDRCDRCGDVIVKEDLDATAIVPSPTCKNCGRNKISHLCLETELGDRNMLVCDAYNHVEHVQDVFYAMRTMFKTTNNPLLEERMRIAIARALKVPTWEGERT